MLTENLISDKFKPQILNFSCLDFPDGQSYLQNEALQHHKNNITHTKLFFNNSELVAYYTVFNDNVKIFRKQRWKFWDKVEWGRDFLPSTDEYPAIKIHFLCVDSRHRHRDFGTSILAHATKHILLLSEQVGCTFVTLQPRVEAKLFYKKFGFVEIQDHMVLFIPTYKKRMSEQEITQQESEHGNI